VISEGCFRVGTNDVPTLPVFLLLGEITARATHIATPGHGDRQINGMSGVWQTFGVDGIRVSHIQIL
jgi:hypothetical protein